MRIVAITVALAVALSARGQEKAQEKPLDLAEVVKGELRREAMLKQAQEDGNPILLRELREANTRRST
jgi:hypothetical protein